MSYVSECDADGPVLALRMQEASGLIQDSSGNANHATVKNGAGVLDYQEPTPITSDQPDFALEFESGASSFTIDDDPTLDLGDVGTWECWIKRADVTAVIRTILSKGTNAYAIGLGTTGKFFCARSGHGIIASSLADVPLSVWTYCAWTKSGATNVLYINGAVSTGTVTNLTLTDTALPLFVGALDATPAEPTLGLLDEVRIYPTALSAARILAHYNAALTGLAWMRA